MVAIDFVIGTGIGDGKVGVVNVIANVKVDKMVPNAVSVGTVIAARVISAVVVFCRIEFVVLQAAINRMINE